MLLFDTHYLLTYGGLFKGERETFAFFFKNLHILAFHLTLAPCNLSLSSALSLKFHYTELCNYKSQSRTTIKMALRLSARRVESRQLTKPTLTSAALWGCILMATTTLVSNNTLFLQVQWRLASAPSKSMVAHSTSGAVIQENVTALEWYVFPR